MLTFDDTSGQQFHALSQDEKTNILDNSSDEDARGIIDGYKAWLKARNTPAEETATEQAPVQSQSGGALNGVVGAVAKEGIKQGIKQVGSSAATSTASTGAPEILAANRIPGGESASSMLGNIASGAAIAKGGYDTIESLQNGNEGLRGSLSTLGGGIGSIAGPLGAAAGAIGGNIAGYAYGGNSDRSKAARAAIAMGTMGGSELMYAAASPLMRKNGRQILEERLGGLTEQGVDVPDAQKRVDDYGASKEELIAREQANVDAGIHGNPTFAESRNEADLTPEDTWGGLMWFEQLGNDYLGATAENQRREMNQRALDEGLIDEARGQLNTNNPERLQEIYNEVLEDTEPLNPAAVKDGEPEQFRVQEARSSGGSQRKPSRPKPMNDIPEVVNEPAPVLPPPVQPPPRTAQDYTQAYVDVLSMNQGLAVNPQLSGRY